METNLETDSTNDTSTVLGNKVADNQYTGSANIEMDVAVSLPNIQNVIGTVDNRIEMAEHATNFTNDVLNSTTGPNNNEILNFPVSIPGIEVSSSNNEMDQENITIKTNGLEELMKSQDFYSTIKAEVVISKADAILMILRFALSNYSSFSSICQLFEMVNNMFAQPIFPETRYMLDKYFNDNIKVDFHAICYKCNKYLGNMESANNLSHCISCGEKLDLSNPSSINYFVVIDPSEFIKELLQEFEDYYYYVVRERTKERDHYKDIYDGQCYRNFVNKLSPEDRKQYLTVIFNTDGAPKFESSNYSIWPFYIMPNEIPMQHRRPLIFGFWFGKHKPHMVPYLWPCVESLNALSLKGIPCRIKNENLQIKVFAICSCVDSVARAPMQGVKQFNGYYGCNWCLQEGVWEANYVRFSYLRPAAPLRDEETTLQHMQEALETNKSQFGVLGATALILLIAFNIILGFVPDYMHHFAAGVGPQFANYFEECMTKEDIDAVDAMLLNIKAPGQIARLTRPFSDRGQWKAREWENFILYYSLPVLREIKSVSSAKVKHWRLLVESLHILLSSDIKLSELKRAEFMLNLFVLEAKDLYGERAMTYNVHQLLHLPASVLNWGPLWAHSAFVFEAGNREALQAIKCAKGVTQQIVRFVNLQFAIVKLEREIYLSTSEVVKDYCENLKKERALNVLKLEHATYFGIDVVIDDKIIAQFKLSEQYAKAYQKIVKNHCLFMTSCKDNDRSCNFYAQLTNGKFIQIELFIVESKLLQEFTVCRKLKTRPSKYCPLLHYVIKTEDEYHIIETKNIATICIIMDAKKNRYICPVPNPYHY